MPLLTAHIGLLNLSRLGIDRHRNDQVVFYLSQLQTQPTASSAILGSTLSRPILRPGMEVFQRGRPQLPNEAYDYCQQIGAHDYGRQWFVSR